MAYHRNPNHCHHHHSLTVSMRIDRRRYSPFVDASQLHEPIDHKNYISYHPTLTKGVGSIRSDFVLVVVFAHWNVSVLVFSRRPVRSFVAAAVVVVVVVVVEERMVRAFAGTLVDSSSVGVSFSVFYHCDDDCEMMTIVW